jgi:predicted RNA-binding Zn ribbon-like protein
MSTNGSKTKQDGIALVELRREDIRRMVKPHGGFEKFTDPLVALVRQFPELISRDGIDLEALKTSLATAEALEAPCAQAEQQLRLLADTRFFHQSSAWSVTLLIYDRAKSAARTSPSIARALEAFEAFLKHKKKRLVTPTPVTSSSTT